VSEPDQRIAQVAESDNCLGAGFRCGVRHLLGVRRRCGQRLLTPDCLACDKRRERHWFVQGIGRRDRDYVDCRVGHQGAPISCRSSKSK
jgi:hypothetical protein